MKVTFYINTAENNRVDKTAYLQQVIEVEGSLRTDCSLLSPVIVFEFPNLNPSPVIDEDDEEVVGEDDALVIDSDVFYRFNYAYIKEFERFYFVQDVVIQRSKVFNVFMSCDVLMSFRNDIRSLNAYVERNEFNYDPLLEDELLPFEFAKDVTETDELDTGSMVNTHFQTEFSWDAHNIVGTFISEYAFSENTVTPPEGSGLNTIDSGNFNMDDDVFLLTQTNLSSINRTLVGETDGEYSTFIKSIIALPYEPPLSEWAQETNIHVGKEDGVDPKIIGRGYQYNLMSDYIVIADFNVPDAESFIDFSPYSLYELFIPFYGWTALNYLDIRGCRIIVYYSVNHSDGSATAYVWNVTHKRIVFSTTCQLGVPISYNVTNNYELKTREQALNLNLAVGLISSIVSTGIGVATQNPVAIAGGVMGAGKAIVTHVNSNAQLIERASSTFSGSKGGLYSSLKARLRITRMRKILTLDLTKYAHQVGRPLRTTRYLSGCRGFTIVSEIHLENINAFKKEKEEIERLLKLGVIL